LIGLNDDINASFCFVCVVDKNSLPVCLSKPGFM
jgi:hypothetical protein